MSRSALSPILRIARAVSSSSVAFALEVAGLFQLLGHLAQPLEVAGRLLAQELLDLLGVDLLEVVGVAHLLDLPLELVELAELVHQVHGLLQRQSSSPRKL